MSTLRSASRPYLTAHDRRYPSLTLLMIAATAPLVAFSQPDGVVFEIQVPDMDSDDDDTAPMGLRDVASVFPFAGPFAPVDGAPGDRFIHEVMGANVNRDFLEQLLPVLQSRFQEQHPCDADVRKLCPHADAPLHCLGKSREQLSAGCANEIKHAVPFVCSQQIEQFCSDDIDKSVLSCLEQHGSNLGVECEDAVVAAKHAISSLAASQKKAGASMSGAKKSQVPSGSQACPSGWAPGANGCCTKRWSPSCAAMCAAQECTRTDGNWGFKWLDFRTKPYTCCPLKPKGKEYVGGQTLCPLGWTVEHKAQGNCCRRSWSWDCGHDCAKARCSGDKDFTWMPVNENSEQYRCCPSHLPEASMASKPSRPKAAVKDESIKKAAESTINDMPDGLGQSWVGKPINLAAGGWTTYAVVAAVAACICLFRRSPSQPQAPRYNYKERLH